jgi:hypothetical protein
VELKKDAWEREKIRTFHYEIMWERVNTLSEEIEKAWCSTNDRESLGRVMNKLRNLQTTLRHWSREHFGAVTEELACLRHELGEIKARTVVCCDDIRAVTDRMDELLFREDMMWLQRSRISWLKEGDRNTGFFHR